MRLRLDLSGTESITLFEDQEMGWTDASRRRLLPYAVALVLQRSKDRSEWAAAGFAPSPRRTLSKAWQREQIHPIHIAEAS